MREQAAGRACDLTSAALKAAMMNDVKVAHGSRTCHRNSDSQRTLRNSSELAERTVHQRVQLFVPDKK